MFLIGSTAAAANDNCFRYLPDFLNADKLFLCFIRITLTTVFRTLKSYKMNERKPCVLVLVDGTEFAGYSFGSQTLPVDGEVGKSFLK